MEEQIIKILHSNFSTVKASKEIAEHFMQFNQWLLDYTDIGFDNGKYFWMITGTDECLNSSECYSYWQEHVNK